MAEPSPPPIDVIHETISVKLALIEQARRLLGKKAAAVLWRQIGLPMPQEPSRPTSDPPRCIVDFLDQATRRDPDASIQAAILHGHYCHWAAVSGRPMLTQTAFGRAMRGSGVPKVIRRHALYLGLRISPYPPEEPDPPPETLETAVVATVLRPSVTVGKGVKGV